MSYLLYGNVRVIGDPATAPGAGADGSRPVAVDEEGSLYVRFAPGGAAGASLDPVEHVEEAELPAAGAFTDQDTYAIPSGLRALTVVITYTLNADSETGFVRCSPRWTFDALECPQPVIASPPSSTSADGRFKRQQAFGQEFDLPVPAGATAEIWALTFDVPAGAQAFRLLLGEGGDPTFPGVVAATLIGSY